MPISPIVKRTEDVLEWQSVRAALSTANMDLGMEVMTVRIKTTGELREVMELHPNVRKKLIIRTHIPEIKEKIKEVLGGNGHVRDVLGHEPKYELSREKAKDDPLADAFPDIDSWQLRAPSELTENLATEKMRDWLVTTERRLYAGETVRARLTSLKGIEANAPLLRRLLLQFQKTQFHFEADNNISGELRQILTAAKGKPEIRSFDDTAVLEAASYKGHSLENRRSTAAQKQPPRTQTPEPQWHTVLDKGHDKETKPMAAHITPVDPPVADRERSKTGPTGNWKHIPAMPREKVVAPSTQPKKERGWLGAFSSRISGLKNVFFG